MNIILEIQNKYNSLTQKEKELVDYILKNKNKINNISITTLSKEIGISPSTITRFSKKINCDSFVDMKMKLNLLKNEVKQKKSDNIFSNVHNYYAETINNAKNLLTDKSINNLVREIKKSNKIYIYGVGSSGLSGQEIMQRLLRMGFNVHCITDSHMMRISSAIVSDEDLVIGISISGETKEVIDALKICKRNNAKTIGISGSKESRINKFVDELIIVPNTSFIGNETFINTQFSTMYLFDLISMILLNDLKLKEKMQKTVDVIINPKF
ncbi:MurR/RpiR family transcriptional regulator (plasmid) [Fusobacteria bacterium ZRK30]|nr:MurR/RpiR family transcriptional regulator [Fusobacteria bacterium ZRK30]